MLTKEVVLQALKEGRVAYSVLRNGRFEGPFPIPAENEAVRITDQKQKQVSDQPHTRE